MSLLVQKFGGSSLDGPDGVRRCAARAVAARDAGHEVLVVVSAMGGTTDDLLALSRRVTDDPPRRELDLLLATGEQMSTALMAMAIQDLGAPAVSLTPRTLGLRTDPVHCNAKIRSIDVERVRADLDAGRIVVVPGFQGLSDDDQVTTLGRGGSDTTAVAIAAALGVREDHGTCEIFTDVDGVYTADPRLVPGARKLSRVSYEEMVELASAGAGVLHPRAAMFGQRFGVPIHVRHSARPEPGTMVDSKGADADHLERATVVGCALTADLARVTIRGLPNRPGAQSTIFRHIERSGILVDDIMQVESGSMADVSFTVDGQSCGELEEAVAAALAEIGGGSIELCTGLAKVVAVGVGMRTHTGVAAKMFAALGRANINIANITTSEINVTCIVARDDGHRALQVVHDAFDLSSVGGPSIMDTGATGRTVPGTEPRP